MSCTSVSISNGYILSSSNLYNINGTVTYYCNTFYYLSGNPVATCLDTYGNWTSIPSCEFAATKNGKFDRFLQRWKVFIQEPGLNSRFLLMCLEFVSFCFTFLYAYMSALMFVVDVWYFHNPYLMVIFGMHFGSIGSHGIRLDVLKINLPFSISRWHARYKQFNW